MRYLADVLTLLRLVIGIIICFVLLQAAWELAAILSVAGILSDAFDGMAARRWPYGPRQNRRLFWRRTPEAWDNLADTVLTFGAAIGLAFTQLSWRMAVLAW